MPAYRVHEVQEEVVIRKWHYIIEADSEDDAVEKAMSGEVDPVEQGTMGDADYAVSGWSVRPADVPEDETAWSDAAMDLEARRLM